MFKSLASRLGSWLHSQAKTLTIGLFVIAVILFFILIIESVNHGKSYDLFISVFGASIAGVIAFFIARWQFHKEKVIEQSRYNELFVVVKKEIAKELRDNYGLLTKLERTLDIAQAKDRRMWAKASSIVGQLNKSAYDMLSNNGLLIYISTLDLNIIYSYYLLQSQVVGLVSEGRAAIEPWGVDGKNEEDEMIEYAKNAKTMINTTIMNYESDPMKKFINEVLGN